jgi:hypothetical protein
MKVRVKKSPVAARSRSRATQDSGYRFFLAFFLDSLVFACSRDFFRLRRRLISFCRSLAI